MTTGGLRPGWRWHSGELWLCEEWELADEQLSPTERTKLAMAESLKGLVSCLDFTTETHEDFPESWLPTLDLSIKVNEQNQVQYKFFEKPTASKLCLQADTALGQNCLVQSLAQDTIRRMLNCSEHITIEERREVVDKFGQKMANSGHKTEEIRRNLISGLKGWKTKQERSRKTGAPLQRNARESAASRRLKKLTGKATWFKDKPKGDQLTSSEETSPEQRGSTPPTTS